jgi:outer membrane immunogenic protein
MRSIFLASAAVLCMAGGAAAEQTAASWTGAYLGVHGGYGLSTPGFEAPRENVEGDLGDYSFTAGLYGGYDWQRGGLVLGLSGDLDYLGLDGGEALAQGEEFGKFDRYEYDIDWVATGRVRAGHLVGDDALVYASAGLAVAGVSASSFRQRTSVLEGFTVENEHSLSRVRAGGVVGAGAEWRVQPNWSVKVDYSFHAFQDFTVGGEGLTDAVRISPRLHSWRIGLAYRF